MDRHNHIMKNQKQQQQQQMVTRKQTPLAPRAPRETDLVTSSGTVTVSGGVAVGVTHAFSAINNAYGKAAQAVGPDNVENGRVFGQILHEALSLANDAALQQYDDTINGVIRHRPLFVRKV